MAKRGTVEERLWALAEAERMLAAGATWRAVSRATGLSTSTLSLRLGRRRKPQPTADAKFWQRVDRSDGCWTWRGWRSPQGYGRIWRDSKHVFAHRASWEINRGPIPPGLFVLHHCDNPPCVRPDHLFLGTLADNNADRDAKGRHVKSRPSAKLTPGDVLRARADWARGELVICRRARELGVSPGTIRFAVEGITWRDL